MQNQALDIYFRLIMQMYDSAYIASRKHTAMAA